MMSAMVDVRHLTVQFNHKNVLDDVSLTVQQGEVVAILGRSGCGKSTLMQHIIGLQVPQQGEVFIQGQPVDTFSNQALCCQIGVMFQSGALFGSMTVLDNIELPLHIWTPFSAQARRQLALSKLDLVGLKEAGDLYPAELSGGMQKRAAIARAMVMEPNILFLDEPSAGLDPITAYDLDQLLARLAREQGMTLMIVTHELASIFRLCSRAIFLKAGHVIADDKPQRLAESHDDEEIYQFLNIATV